MSDNERILEVSEETRSGAEKRFVDGSVDIFLPSDFLLDCSSIALHDELAKGSFGVVYKGTLEGETETCAVKIVEYNTNIEEQINVIIELSVLQSMPHERLVKFKGAAYLPTPTPTLGAKIMIVMEMCGNGALRECLKLNLPWRLRVRIALEVSQGIEFLHSNGIIHRDIKTTNVLIDDDWHAKLCDFSFACHEDCTTKSDFIYGTEEFMSPEIALMMDFDQSADIFSLGIILCELITGIEPSKKFLHRRPQELFQFNELELRHAVPPDCPEALEALALQCCDVDPGKRPLASTCVEELHGLLDELGGGDDLVFNPAMHVSQPLVLSGLSPMREGNVIAPRTPAAAGPDSTRRSSVMSGLLGMHDNNRRSSMGTVTSNGMTNTIKEMDTRFAFLELQVQELRAENKRLSRELHAMVVLTITAGEKKGVSVPSSRNPDVFPSVSATGPRKPRRRGTDGVMMSPHGRRPPSSTSSSIDPLILSVETSSSSNNNNHLSRWAAGGAAAAAAVHGALTSDSADAWATPVHPPRHITTAATIGDPMPPRRLSVSLLGDDDQARGGTVSATTAAAANSQSTATAMATAGTTGGMTTTLLKRGLVNMSMSNVGPQGGGGALSNENAVVLLHNINALQSELNELKGQLQHQLNGNNHHHDHHPPPQHHYDDGGGGSPGGVAGAIERIEQQGKRRGGSGAGNGLVSEGGKDHHHEHDLLSSPSVTVRTNTTAAPRSKPTPKTGLGLGFEIGSSPVLENTSANKTQGSAKQKQQPNDVSRYDTETPTTPTAIAETPSCGIRSSMEAEEVNTATATAAATASTAEVVDLSSALGSYLNAVDKCSDVSSKSNDIIKSLAPTGRGGGGGRGRGGGVAAGQRDLLTGYDLDLLDIDIYNEGGMGSPHSGGRLSNATEEEESSPQLSSPTLASPARRTPHQADVAAGSSGTVNKSYSEDDTYRRSSAVSAISNVSEGHLGGSGGGSGGGATWRSAKSNPACTPQRPAFLVGGPDNTISTTGGTDANSTPRRPAAFGGAEGSAICTGARSNDYDYDDNDILTPVTASLASVFRDVATVKKLERNNSDNNNNLECGTPEGDINSSDDD